MNLSNSINETLRGLLKSVDGTARRFAVESVSGGSINHAYKITDSNSNKFFLKTNSSVRFPQLFQKEKSGLEFISSSKAVRVPKVIYCGECEDDQLLLLEWIEQAPKTQGFWKNFGRQLAQLHKQTQSGFGFELDNYMGSLHQSNTITKKWTEFFINQRLLPQVTLASQRRLLNKKAIELFEKLFSKLDAIFPNSPPALVHGDLWSGNFICSTNDLPVLIDPAVYFGHPSADLGLSTLFGGFEQGFYDAYNYHSPFPSNYDEQWQISNLYPLLIHLNLFGASYQSQINETLQKFAGT